MSKAENSYRAPRTGEPRRHTKPLKVDRLPAGVKETITKAREAGETWKRVSQLASAAAGTRVAPSTCQRWYDLRIDQPRNAGNVLLRKIVSLLEDIREAVRA